MIGAVAGDIIGSRFEGQQGIPTWFDLFHPRCRFTDDSVCTLAVADALMNGKNFSEVLRDFVKRHPGRGYGGMFRRWAACDAGPYGSWGNGAPMRTAAVGWLMDDEGSVLEMAERQAAVTHNHPDAVAATQAVSLSILWLREGEEPTRVRNRIGDMFDYEMDPETALRPSGFDISAAGTVPVALAAAFCSEDWEDAVRSVIAVGGDTDTLACIAGAVAEAVHGVPGDIAAAAKAHLTNDLREVLERFSDALEGRCTNG
jgi:ADP-ribosyl-[dinitrogen reductase] hydrolase